MPYVEYLPYEFGLWQALVLHDVIIERHIMKTLLSICLLAIATVAMAAPPHQIVIKPKGKKPIVWRPVVRVVQTPQGPKTLYEYSVVKPEQGAAKPVPDYRDPTGRKEIRAILTPEERGTVIR